VGGGDPPGAVPAGDPVPVVGPEDELLVELLDDDVD
jgi:hypothetical protein